MSVVGLLDSRIVVYRYPQGVTDSFGDVALLPDVLKDRVRASLQTALRAKSQDSGAGDAPTGTMILFFLTKDDIQLGDLIYVRKGPSVGTWWTVMHPIGVSRSQHRESLIKPYIGKTPNVPS
jgi:hypothetical protein